MKRMDLLDYTRFFAAFSVIFFHYTFNGILNGKLHSITYMTGVIDYTKYGYLGVELFFIISGYVILISAQNRTHAQFALSRLVRLYPAYWVAVIFTSLMTYLFSDVSSMSVTVIQFFANLTMFQSYLNYADIDGVYWTLAFEARFYFLVFVILFLSKKKLNHFFIFWPFVMLIARILHIHMFPFLGEYYAYFSAGALIAILKQKRSPLILISLSIAVFLSILYSSGKASWLTETRGLVYSQTTIATIIVLFYSFILAINTSFLSKINLPHAKLLGALTYPIYLIHAHFGYITLNILANEKNKLLTYGFTISMVFLISFLIHFFIENKLHVFWRSLFSKATDKLSLIRVN